MKNLIILVLSILLFYLKYLNCTLIGLGRREEGDKILFKTSFHTDETRHLSNHTILIKVANENPVTYIRFFPNTVFTTSSVTYDGSLVKFVEFTAPNTTNFHINMTVYGYDQPMANIKTRSSLYQELLKLDRLVDSKLNSNSNNNNDNNIINLHTNYINDNVTDSFNGTDYDNSDMDELFNLIGSMKLKNFNLSITNNRLIPIYNQYNEKLLMSNNNSSSSNISNSDSGNDTEIITRGLEGVDPFFVTTLAFLLHTKQNYFDFWSPENFTSSASPLIVQSLPLSPHNLKNFNCFYLVCSLMYFMILL